MIDLTIVIPTYNRAKTIERTLDSVKNRYKNTMLMTEADMNITADMLEALAEFDAVILVEERGKSLGREIQRELECATALKKTMLEYVVL